MKDSQSENTLLTVALIHTLPSLETLSENIFINAELINSISNGGEDN